MFVCFYTHIRLYLVILWQKKLILWLVQYPHFCGEEKKIFCLTQLYRWLIVTVFSRPMQGRSQEFATGRDKRGDLGDGLGSRGRALVGVCGLCHQKPETMLISSYDGGHATIPPLGYATGPMTRKDIVTCVLYVFEFHTSMCCDLWVVCFAVFCFAVSFDCSAADFGLIRFWVAALNVGHVPLPSRRKSTGPPSPISFIKCFIKSGDGYFEVFLQAAKFGFCLTEFQLLQPSAGLSLWYILHLLTMCPS